MDNNILAQAIADAAQGNRSAQEKLYTDGFKSVYFMALKILGNSEDAQDITQEVFLAVFEKIDTLKQPEAYYKWLSRITANKCANLFRSRGRMQTEEIGEEIAQTPDDDMEVMPAEALDDAQTRGMIMEIIESLPEAQRICIMCRFFSEMPVEEIAELVGANVNTVRSRIALGKAKIKEAILAKEEKDGIKLHAIPLIPIFKVTFEKFTIPNGVSELVWGNVAGKAAQGANSAGQASQGANSANNAARTAGKAAKKLSGGAKAAIITAAAIAVVGGAAAGVIALNENVVKPALSSLDIGGKIASELEDMVENTDADDIEEKFGGENNTNDYPNEFIDEPSGQSYEAEKHKWYGTYAMGNYYLLFIDESSIYMLDGNSQGHYSIDGGIVDGNPEEPDTLKFVMSDPSFDYYAEYTLVFHGDTITLTHLYEIQTEDGGRKMIEISDSGVYSKTDDDPTKLKMYVKSDTPFNP